jgi:predicted DNA-binding transcriptional regulator YafY
METKSKIITFALDRMSNLVVTEDYFATPVDFNSDIYFKNTIGITSTNSQPEKIIFKLDAVGSKYLDSQPIHHTQKIIKKGKKRNTYQIKVIQSEELKRFFLSYGKQLEVIEPQSLRDYIANEITEMMELYG